MMHGATWSARVRRYFIAASRRRRLHWPLLLALLALMALGLLTLFSASDENPQVVAAQALRFGIGLLLLLALAAVPPSLLRQWTPWLYALSVALLIVVAVLGEGHGASRWLDLGVVRFQPSEILKFTVPMMVAWYLHVRPLPPSWWHTAVAAVLILVPAALIVRQPDLGTAILVAAAGLFVLFLAGIGWWRIAGLAIVAGLLAPVGWFFMHDYQRQRVLTFLNPELDPLGSGWHIIQSKIAVGSGGVLGKGFHHGTQSQLQFLPEHTTDFILAVYSEEFGLIGVLLLLALYLFIIGTCLWVAMRARDTYSRLLAGAIALSFSVYVAVNGGMVAGLLPVVGVPLPLVSYGGTSAISVLIGFGIVMSVHTHRRPR